MHSALNFLTGGRQFKGRLFQWSKPAPKIDGFAPKEPSSNHLSRLWKHSRETGRGKWAYLPKPTEDLPGTTQDPPSSSSNSSSHGIIEQRQEQEVTGNGSGHQGAVLPNPQVADCIAKLQRHRKITTKVLAQVFELNALRAPMFQQTEDVVAALQEFILEVADLTKSVELSEPLAAQLGNLQRKFDLFRKGTVASFRADQAQCARLEDEIIQSLFHSGRRLDGFLETNAIDPAALGDVASDTNASLAGEYSNLARESAEYAPEDIQYLAMIGDRDMIVEQLLDLREEQAQLLQEQDSRAQFGISMDDDSLHFLESFECEERTLLDELELADLRLEAMKQLITDDEALAISNEASEREPDEDEGATRHLQVVRPLTQPSPSPTQPAMQTRLSQTMLHRKIKYVDHLRGLDMLPVDHGDLINVWLLHRVQFLPRLLHEYTALIERQYEEVDEDDLEHLFLEKWFNDSSAADFTRHRIFADQQSMQANLAESGDLAQKSLSALPIRPTSSSLLRIGPSTTAQDIIAQAMHARGMSPSQLSTT
ncbi:hypothetical protein AYO20_05398 [Fonsecaea nubica]|uniref:Uncharacterized protein n=1 Tax=Fonsecaea nubica TaxID=856822 RepID=A0A178D119_9EURO|nr:hypothetical protein AYO20_05398 [Fonsecaea nubica]OAL35347.1 hypothetical protein AYO20_05398 [Fonsecaea nubica]